MARQIFVNLPVHDLPSTRSFFAALGFGFNEQYSDENAACLVIDDNIFAMLLTVPFFQSFTPKPVADATQVTEVLIALSAESREAVDAMVAMAVAHGGGEARAAQDLGFMYSRAFADIDGHIWEIVWMNAPEG